MVLDTLTGLRWSRDANPFEFPYSWEEAFDLIAGLNRSRTHGREDWRLPSRRELFSLISHRLINPALPQGHPFRNVFHGYYWTATPCARLSDQAWYIHLGGGRVYRGRQQGACLVWPVAGSGWHPLPPAQRFRVQGLAVEDRLTELWWTPSARTGCAQMTWEDALRAPSALNRDKYGGRTDWRLPNIRELESLVDLARHSPALRRRILSGMPRRGTGPPPPAPTNRATPGCSICRTVRWGWGSSPRPPSAPGPWPAPGKPPPRRVASPRDGLTSGEPAGGRRIVSGRFLERIPEVGA